MFNRRQLLAGGSALIAGTALARPALAQSTRTITTSYGTYDIPTDPKRVVLMGNRFDLETMLALGITPVAMGIEYSFPGSHNENVAPWVPFDPSNIATFSMEATAEQILAHDPDLIVLRGYTSEWYPERFAQLSAVIPHIPTNLLGWREDLAQVAGWLGRASFLAETIATYEAKRDEVKTKHAAVIPAKKIAFGSVEPPVVWLVTTDGTAPAAETLKDLGGVSMTVPAGTTPEGGWYQVSPENLGVIGDNADAILLWAPTRDVLDQFVAQNPLWPRLPQVEAKRAVLAPNNVGNGSVYTMLETLKLWDEVFTTLA